MDPMRSRRRGKTRMDDKPAGTQLAGFVLEGTVFLGWYDPDKKKPVAEKIADGVARYQDKFGAAPEQVLVSPEDFAAASLSVDLIVREFGYIHQHTFYIGVNDEAQEDRR